MSRFWLVTAAPLTPLPFWPNTSFLDTEGVDCQLCLLWVGPLEGLDRGYGQQRPALSGARLLEDLERGPGERFWSPGRCYSGRAGERVSSESREPNQKAASL